MFTLEQARDYVLATCPPREPRSYPVGKALGLVTAEDIFATESIPRFANTAMDGFAVRSADVASPPVELEIVETIAAGHAPQATVGPGQASRIMTGAVIPPGADAVVMVERTSVASPDADSANGTSGDALGTTLGKVSVQIAVPAGNHVRNIGDDLAEGALALKAGTVLGAGHLGVLASLGRTEVLAYPRLQVGVISTGDELVDDGTELAPGQIRDSNRATLLGLLAANHMVPVDLGLVRDDEAKITAAIENGVRSCDALITSGGVSMGDFDYVKEVLDRIGEMRWMQIAIKPAKPFAFGTVSGVPVFGLPGNPVSSMVSFELLALGGLRSMMGHRQPVRQALLATAAEDLQRKPDGKVHYMRVVVEPPRACSSSATGGGAAGETGDGAAGNSGGSGAVGSGAAGETAGRAVGSSRMLVRSAGGQGSHMLWSMAHANALAVVPDGPGIKAGESVGVLLLDGFE